MYSFIIAGGEVRGSSCVRTLTSSRLQRDRIARLPAAEDLVINFPHNPTPRVDLGFQEDRHLRTEHNGLSFMTSPTRTWCSTDKGAELPAGSGAKDGGVEFYTLSKPTTCPVGAWAFVAVIAKLSEPAKIKSYLDMVFPALRLPASCPQWTQDCVRRRYCATRSVVSLGERTSRIGWQV